MSPTGCIDARARDVFSRFWGADGERRVCIPVATKGPDFLSGLLCADEADLRMAQCPESAHCRPCAPCADDQGIASAVRSRCGPITTGATYRSRPTKQVLNVNGFVHRKSEPRLQTRYVR